MPMRDEIPPLPVRSYGPTSTVENARSRVVAALSDRDLQAVSAFCAIGILLAINVILRFPDFGQQVAALAVFP